MKRLISLFAVLLSCLLCSISVFAASGESVSGFDLSSVLFSSLIFGAVLSGVVVFVLVSQLKNVSSKDAMAYFNDDKFDVKLARDFYLYRTITRSPRPQNDNNRQRR